MSNDPLPANLALYEKLVATFPQVERKGATMPYTSFNGHMFSFLTPQGPMALRMSREDREAFLKKYKTSLCEQHGRVMKEYVIVPDHLLKKTREVSPYFQMSIDYIGTLKPKATTRKVKKATTPKKVAKKKTGKATASATKKKKK